MCVGIIRVSDFDVYRSATRDDSFKYLSRGTGIIKPSSSLLTQREKEVVDDFIKKAVNHCYGVQIVLVVIFFAAL